MDAETVCRNPSPPERPGWRGCTCGIVHPASGPAPAPARPLVRFFPGLDPESRAAIEAFAEEVLKRATALAGGRPPGGHAVMSAVRTLGGTVPAWLAGPAGCAVPAPDRPVVTSPGELEARRLFNRDEDGDRTGW